MAVLRSRQLVGLGMLAAVFLLLGSHPSKAQYHAASTTSSVQKEGATKNVAVELVGEKSGLTRKIIALKGAEFAAKVTTSARVAPLLPEFSPGDRNITIKIDPSVGFNVLLGLKFFDPVTINITPDGAIEADRSGVRAVAFQGQAVHSDCFLAAAQAKDKQGREVYDLRASPRRRPGQATAPWCALLAKSCRASFN